MLKNCWEFKNCGREPGGSKVAELGVCPAASEVKINGINNGKNGGRACWAISGTFCGGKPQGSYAIKLGACMNCDFYIDVHKEEGRTCMSSKEILKRIS